MAEDLHKIKRRLGSIRATRKITNAMELVATVKLRKYRANLLASQNYAYELKEILSQLVNASNNKKYKDVFNDYIFENDKEKELVIVVTSDLGLCASYNADIFKFVEKNIKKEDAVLMPIGKKGEKYFKSEGYQLDGSLVNFGNQLFYRDLSDLGEYLLKIFKNKEYRKITLIATKYVNSISFKPRMINLLPLDLTVLNKKLDKESPITDQNVDILLKDLLPKYLTGLIYNAFVEAFVSEEASRRNAMENATDNADDLISELTLSYNKARQDAITREITEVVSTSVRR